LIEKHLLPHRGVETENPFPLLDLPDRSIAVNCEQEPIGPAQRRPGGIAHVRCLATYYGFADPSARWSANGHAVTSDYPITAFDVTATVAHEIPSQPDHFSFGEETVRIGPAAIPVRLPDPPDTWREAILWVNWVRLALLAIADVAPEVSHQIAGALAAELGVERALFAG
jgi:hypothetical protein